MDNKLTDLEKLKIKNYIEYQPVKVVQEFDYINKKIKYNGIKNADEIRVIRGDEEIVRAYLLTRLVNELGYNSENIEIEHEYTAGRPFTNTSRIDIIVRDNNNDAFLFIELKSPVDYHLLDTDKYIEEQLFKVSGMERQEGHNVKYLVYYTFDIINDQIKDECIIIDNEKYHVFSEWKEERNATDELPERYGISKKKAYIKGSNKDLETNFSTKLLDKLQTDLHNVLWGGGSTDDNEIFSSLTNLILAKIEDEDITEDGQEYGFQCFVYDDNGTEVYESNQELFNRINTIYRKALKDRLNITDNNILEKSFVIDTNKFSANKLKYTVQQLEKFSFVDGKNSVSGKDILGDFFESIVRTGFKQSKGQFFTPLNVVKFMLWGLQTDKLAISRINDDLEIPYFIDSSAGSGSFLIEYMKFITENVYHRFRDKISTRRAVQNKIIEWFPSPSRENSWAQTFVYGSELNFNLGTAIKVNMILHGDGSANIFVGGQKGDGLLPFNKYVKNGGINELDKNFTSDIYAKKVNERFDIILTNPPFSVDLDGETKRSLTENYIFSNKENSENLFLERYYQLLKPKGRMAVVLPESIFDTTDNRYIRLFLYKYFNIKAVVSLPQLTFQPYTSTKTSILFAQKKTKEQVAKFNEIWNKYKSLWSHLSLRALNLVDVYINGKNKNKLTSIKDLDEKSCKDIILQFLDDIIEKEDLELSIKDLLEKYQDVIRNRSQSNNDAEEEFGKVNIGWIFSRVSKEVNYNILMCEAEQIGFKRTIRGIKETDNDLYRIDSEGQVIVDDGVCETILDHMRNIRWE